MDRVRTRWAVVAAVSLASACVGEVAEPPLLEGSSALRGGRHGRDVVSQTSDTSSTTEAESVATSVAAPEFVLMWGSYGTAPGQFRSPDGLTVSAAGLVYTTEVDNYYRVQAFDLDGTFVRQWGGTGSGPGQLDSPSGIAAAPDGRLYVADRSNDRIQIFDADGAYAGELGSYGSGPGQFNLPTGVAVASDGTVYVADRNNDRIQRFDGSGAYLGQWSGGSVAFLRPEVVHVSPAGEVYVGDGRYLVQVFDAVGNHLRDIGAGTAGSGPGQFGGKVSGIAVDGAGNTYVVDLVNHRVQRFDPSGVYATEWGGFGFTAGKFFSPVEIAIAPDGSLFVTDGGNQRVQKFAYPDDGAPSPATSDVGHTVAACPGGDIPYEVTVRDASGAPVPGATVRLSFSTAAAAAMTFCDGAVDPSNVVETADADGVATFHLRAGGCVVPSGDTRVDVYANGVQLNTSSLFVASPDVDGDGAVLLEDLDYLTDPIAAGYYDACADFDGDLDVDLDDANILTPHGAWGHACGGS